VAAENIRKNKIVFLIVFIFGVQKYIFGKAKRDTVYYLYVNFVKSSQQ